MTLKMSFTHYLILWKKKNVHHTCISFSRKIVPYVLKYPLKTVVGMSCICYIGVLKTGQMVQSMPTRSHSYIIFFQTSFGECACVLCL